MSTITYIYSSLQGYRIADMKRLSAISGVPFRTLYKIKRGITKDPKSSTIDALMAALRGSTGKAA